MIKFGEWSAHGLHEWPDGQAGATVLLSRSRAANLPAMPLVSWQRYGKGKSMYVGTDDLWRLRREVGDQFHAGSGARRSSSSLFPASLAKISRSPWKPAASNTPRVNGSSFAMLTENFDPVDYESYSVLLDRNGSVDYPSRSPSTGTRQSASTEPRSWRRTPEDTC